MKIANNNSDSEPNELETIHILIKEKQTLLKWCFDILVSKLKHIKYEFIPDIITKLEDENRYIPFFITWINSSESNDEDEEDEEDDEDSENIKPTSNHIKTKQVKSEKEGELRGCIGSLNKMSLLQLKYYTLESALNDRRFDPIDVSELPNLTIHITFLFNFESCSLTEWIIGIHGIAIKFENKGIHYSATFLPEVALKNNFTKEETIKKLIRKSGYFSTINNKLLESIEVTRYEGVLCSMSYLEYQKLSMK